MKYLQEIAVAALVVIAASCVYKVTRHRHFWNKHDTVRIQSASGGANGSGPGPFGGKAKQKMSQRQSS